MKSRVAILDESGTIRNLKPIHKILGRFLEEKWDEIMKVRVRGNIAEFIFSSEEWHRIKREVGFKGYSITVLVDGNQITILKKEDDKEHK